VTFGVLDFVDAEGIDSPHGVQQEDEIPKGNELKAPLAELIVAGSGLMAARADRGRAPARPHETSILLWSGLKRARRYTNPRKRWQRFRIAISSITVGAGSALAKYIDLR